MKVTLINKDEVRDFLEKHGRVACICYNTNPKHSKVVGKSVLESGHMSGSRGIYFNFEFENVPRSEIDQSVRHDIGTFKNVQSFRYVKMNDFTYYTDKLINQHEDVKEVYDDTMNIVRDRYTQMVGMLEEKGVKGERANQAVRGVLPMNTNSKFIQGFTAEALFNFMNKRLCLRAENHIREIANMMKEEVLSILPEFEPYLVADCEKKLFCDEGKHSCGKYITKDKMINILNDEDVKAKIKKIRLQGR